MKTQTEIEHELKICEEVLNQYDTTNQKGRDAQDRLRWYINGLKFALGTLK